VRAAIYRSYGPPEVIEVVDMPEPTMTDDKRVLVRVDHASVNPFDLLHRKGYWPTRPSQGLTRPKDHRLGIDVAGTVVAVGKGVTRFRVGDRVFGSCLGSYAQYVCPRQSSLSLMPQNLTFAAAAALPCAAQTALQALRDVAQVKPGDKVLVYGASGGVGHFAVQLARAFGAEVTAVCSTANLAWVGELGADHLFDYTKEDFAATGKRYDLILDAVGKRTFFSCVRALTETGLYITEHPIYPLYHPIQLFIGSVLGRKKPKVHFAQPRASDLEYLRELVEGGQVRPVIERSYPLDQVVEAHRHVESGRTKGKVVLAVQPETESPPNE